MSRAEKRKRYGKWMDAAPSRFLLEIPESLIQARRGPKPLGEERRRSMVDALFRKLDQLDKSTIAPVAPEPVPELEALSVEAEP
jgi:hypothetical protein